ncbi:MAG: T9SS type A sorting domain-containing protein [Bacteroidetes bacterium]|nr:T9SS type A sorting domain-containing protein [Bacteroidota bacterium]
MKNTQLFIVLLLLSLPASVFSQNENNVWYFGDHASMWFDESGPVAYDSSSMRTLDNCTSISNSAGQLLFYSNGINIWDREHHIMPNGTGLLGDTSATNGALAVKQPGHSDIYYLFTNDAFVGEYGFRYSIIDMTLNNGLGDVIIKNLLILNPNTEKTLAIPHNNKQDVWIIAHEWGSDAFNAYLLSEHGLDVIPVVSHVGSIHIGGTYGTYNSMGQIAATQNGLKIGLAIYDLGRFELFDFDNSTGIISNPIVINGHQNAWGVEFSPDNSKMYTTTWKSGSVYQFDISSNDETTINNSGTLVGEVTCPNPIYKAGFMQIGPDSCIYIAKFESYNLAGIKFPNRLGIDCGFTDTIIDLVTHRCLAGLPTFVKTTNLISTDTNDVIDDKINKDIIQLYPNPTVDNLTIKINSTAESLLRIDLLKVNGQFINTLYSGTIKKGVSFMEYHMQDQLHTGLQSGVYVLSFLLNNQHYLKKITYIND